MTNRNIDDYVQPGPHMVNKIERHMITDKKDPRRYRERAPWERDDPDTTQDKPDSGEQEFNEEAFLSRSRRNSGVSRSRSRSMEVEAFLTNGGLYAAILLSYCMLHIIYISVLI